MYLFNRKRIQQLESEALLDLSGDYNQGSTYGGGGGRVVSQQYQPVIDQSLGAPSFNNTHYRQGSNASNLQYHIEPFVLPPSEDGRLNPFPPSPPTAAPPLPVGRVSHEGSRTEGSNAGNKVYVVHHDSNAPPVTIYHEDGTQIVELPPMYPNQQGRGGPIGVAAPEALSSRSPVRSPVDSRSDYTATTTATTRTLQTTNVTDEVPAFLQQTRYPNQPHKPPRDVTSMRTRGPTTPQG